MPAGHQLRDRLGVRGRACRVEEDPILEGLCSREKQVDDCMSNHYHDQGSEGGVHPLIRGWRWGIQGRLPGGGDISVAT